MVVPEKSEDLDFVSWNFLHRRLHVPLVFRQSGILRVYFVGLYNFIVFAFTLRIVLNGTRTERTTQEGRCFAILGYILMLLRSQAAGICDRFYDCINDCLVIQRL